jgi:hypothetical protein
MFRKPQVIRMSVVLLLALFLPGMVMISVAQAQNFQNVPIILRASEVVPRGYLSGPNYTVKETVRNDGFVNTYEIESQYGPLRVESTSLLLKRINEFKAISKIDQLKGTNVYADAFKAAAMGPVKTAEGLVTDPVGTATGIFSGIGNFFGKASDAITSSDPDKDKPLNAIAGQSAFKREYAHQFDIDPYTTFEPLQKALNDLAWTAAAGGLTVRGAFMAVPGGAGAVVSYSGTADTMKNLVRDKTPAELDKINRESLRSMGVDEGLASLFLSGTSYSPREKTFLVGALASMTGVSDRRIFVQLAAIDCEEAVALFMRVRAQLLAQYSEKTKSVVRFVSAAGVPLLLTRTGVVVGAFPLDHVAWTERFAQKVLAVSSAIAKMPGITGKELWVTGTIDPVARKALEDSRWKVEDRVLDRLLK